MGAGRPREDREIIDGVVKAVELFQKRADEYDALTRKEKRQEREGKTDGGSDLS